MMLYKLSLFTALAAHQLNYFFRDVGCGNEGLIDTISKSTSIRLVICTGTAKMPSVFNKLLIDFGNCVTVFWFSFIFAFTVTSDTESLS
jgi:hypothetical protein